MVNRVHLKEIDNLLRVLFPLTRSITGEGLRKTLRVLKTVANFNIFEVPSGTKCFDWKIPPEWQISAAYIKDSSGKKIVDFSDNNLHLVNYSESVNKIVSFKELDEHLHTLPDLPKAIPYRTSYYKKNWGFCISYNQYKKLARDGKYHVVIKSKFKRGSLTYGEKVLNGFSGQEYLISTYSCHPSLANDNLSGIILWSLLLRELKKTKTYHSYRFVIAPETIGALSYLWSKKNVISKVKGGFVITCVAGSGPLGYKETFLGNHLIDKVVRMVFRDLGIAYKKYPFDVHGSDERQYSSPYFRIPIGTITKDKYYEYRYYHTSLDNLKFIKSTYLVHTLRIYLKVIEYLELNRVYKSLNPWGEPMLGKRGVYPDIGGAVNPKRTNRDNLEIMRWLLFYCDGQNSLLDIYEKTGVSLPWLDENVQRLQEMKLLKEVRE